MIKIKDQCKQTAPARVFHLSLAGAAFYILSLIRCGGLFKFCRDLLEQFADGEVLRADLFAFAAFETVGRSAAGRGMDDAVVMQPKTKFFLTLSMSDTPFVF